MVKSSRLIFLMNSAHRRMQLWIAAHQVHAAADADDATATPAASAPTPAQSGVLFMLEKSDGAAMGELSQALHLVPSATSGLVQRMEALGWVARKPCPEDARAQRAWLTPAGRRLLPGLHAALVQINRGLKEGFTEAELQVVARWLQHVQQLNTSLPDAQAKE